MAPQTAQPAVTLPRLAETTEDLTSANTAPHVRRLARKTQTARAIASHAKTDNVFLIVQAPRLVVFQITNATTAVHQFLLQDAIH